jgi:hypothetical protein
MYARMKHWRAGSSFDNVRLILEKEKQSREKGKKNRERKQAHRRLCGISTLLMDYSSWV